jgi:hypothetical protein
VALAATFYVVRLRLGDGFSSVAGGPPTFLSVPLMLGLIAGGMVVGCLGGYVVARRVR